MKLFFSNSFSRKERWWFQRTEKVKKNPKTFDFSTSNVHHKYIIFHIIACCESFFSFFHPESFLFFSFPLQVHMKCLTIWRIFSLLRPKYPIWGEPSVYSETAVSVIFVIFLKVVSIKRLCMLTWIDRDRKKNQCKGNMRVWEPIGLSGVNLNFETPMTCHFHSLTLF